MNIQEIAIAPKRKSLKSPAQWSTSKKWSEAEKWVDAMLDCGCTLHVHYREDDKIGYGIGEPVTPSEKPRPPLYQDEIENYVRIIMRLHDGVQKYGVRPDWICGCP